MTTKSRHEMGVRLRGLVDQAGGIEAVVRALDGAISSSTLARYISGQSEMSAEKLALIATLTESTVDYIVRGVIPPKYEKFARLPSPTFDDEVIVPILEVEASAGRVGYDNGEMQEIAGVRRFPRSRLRTLGVNPDNVHLIYARGDSMLPTIEDGAVVLIDQSRRDPRAGGIYAFSSAGELRLKRLRVRIDGSLVLISDNKEYYPEEVIPKEEINQIKIHGRAFLIEKQL